MELTIERLKMINDHNNKPKVKKSPPPSDLSLDSLSIAVPEVPVDDDVAEEYYVSDDDYLSPKVEKVPIPAPDEEEEGGNGIIDLAELDHPLGAFTVHVDNHRILTMRTHSNRVVARWLRELLRCHRGEILVGVSVDRERGEGERWGSNKRTYRDPNYDIIQLCVGSHCLVYELPDPWECVDGRLALIDFFANPRVTAAGVNMEKVTKKLLKDHEITVTNVMDLNKSTAEVLDTEHDVKRFDLDLLGMTVLGRHWYIDRPKKVMWRERTWYRGEITMEKLMYATYDAYLCFEIGAKLMEIKGPAASGKKKNSKKK